MLHFVFGKASSGKTTFVHKKLGEALEKKEGNAVLIVPEQFTFETDRGILDTLGPVLSNRVDVFSFTRLAEAVYEDCGTEMPEVISEQGRLICMAQALNALQDKIKIYSHHIKNKAFIKSLLLVADEFKQSDADTVKMSDAVNGLDNRLLSEKMRELILIYEGFNAIAGQSLTDTGDVLSKLYELLCEKKWFSGKTVAIDGFTSFNAQVMKIIEAIASQCDDVYITLTGDGLTYSEDRNDPFAFTGRTALKIKAMADKSCIPVGKPVFLTEDITGFKVYSREALEKLEEGFYKTEQEVYSEKTDDICIYCASDISDECEYTARKILSLTREGYRCRDIAVIFRDGEKYENEIRYAFSKYNVPFFHDRREPICNQPLVMLVKSVLEICCEGFSSERILRLLKTGITTFGTEEISEFENYVYMWKIEGSDFGRDWDMNPDGFDSAVQNDEKLCRINSMRKKIADPLLCLKNDIKTGTGVEISEKLYSFLREINADEGLKSLAECLEDDGEYALALEQEQIWDMLIEILNDLAVYLKSSCLTVKEYSDMFDLSLSVKTLGKIPNGIDEVIVGSAGRIKARNIKVVFVLGLNAGVFPDYSPRSGLISDRDRTALLEKGIELFDVNKYKNAEERFIAYNSVCCAREKVFLLYSMRDLRNDKKLPGEIINDVSARFPQCRKEYCETLKDEDKIEGEKGSFELLSRLYREKTFCSENLYDYFSHTEKYGSILKTVDALSKGKDFKIENRDTALELFGENIYLSASNAESYESCPFMFFCRYGIKGYPRKTARLDPSHSGTIVHFVLETLIKKYKETGVQNITPEERSRDIRHALSVYADKYMGGLENKTKRFIYQFDRIAVTLDGIFERISSEMSVSGFVPSDFELKIGEGDIKTYELELSDGGKLELHGSVDRVDVMDIEGKKYLRVIDYKTGSKELKLYDVLNGLNMQMLIYLIALWRNGKDHFGGETVPAAVLYFPARDSNIKADRDANEDILRLEGIKSKRMNGLILEDSRVVKAMDDSNSGLFIPAVTDKKTGRIKSDCVVSMKQFELLNKRIDRILSDMAESLHEGDIKAYPASGINHGNTCDFCDYKSVCGHTDTGKFRVIQSLSHRESLDKLEKEEEEQ